MKNTNGFVAGTLVHTDKGLVPIQAIKVGDKVLSKPESGNGKAEYKKVLSTFKSAEKQKLYKVEYFNVTASERGEKGLNYIFCTDNHLFRLTKKSIADINTSLSGEWFVAENIPAGHLVSAHGDELGLDDYSFLPVRTLPNFPKGCAYVQSIEYHDCWLTDYANNVEFVEFFDDGYKFINLNNGDLDDFNKFQYEFTSKVSFSMNNLNEKEPFYVNEELFKTLTMRLKQDMSSECFTSEDYADEMLSPVIIDGKFVRENRIVGEKGMEAFKRRLKYIEKYGDNSGLNKGSSIHNSMKKYYDDCPNPYENHVYNLEVEDTHTYFIGHDGVWVHT